MQKLLPSDSTTKIGRLLQKLECADRTSNELRRVRYWLDDLEKFRPVTIEQSRIPNLYSTALMPIVEHALVVYCSAFNSGDPRHDGIGKFDSANVFGDKIERQQWHTLLKSYRDKNIAHLTNHGRKTWYFTSKNDRRVGSLGLGWGLIVNSLQPGSEDWTPFRMHLKVTEEWFERKSVTLRQDVEKILSKRPDCWFDRLADVVDG